MSKTFPVKGHISAGFEPVADAFTQNFTNGLEGGAGFCVLRGDEILVNIWGGSRNRKGTLAWEEDTIVPVYSSTKAVAALVLAWLYEQGRFDYEQTLASLWPEFAQNGKGDLTIAQVLSHQAGLSGLTERISPKDWYDWDLICDRMAAQAPIWPPGTLSGYHPLTFGFLAGEIARRSDEDGRTLGTILREEICSPKKIDFHIGTPASQHERCADLHKPGSAAEFGDINEAIRAAFFKPWSAAGGKPVGEWREAEFSATNGHGTAKALASIMQLALDGHIGSKPYLSASTLTALRAPRISGQNLVLPFNITFAAGIMYNEPNFFYGPNRKTVGHSGWGGSCVFADPEAGITASYIMNKQGNALMGDPRSLTIIEALYGCL